METMVCYNNMNENYEIAIVNTSPNTKTVNWAYVSNANLVTSIHFTMGNHRFHQFCKKPVWKHLFINNSRFWKSEFEFQWGGLKVVRWLFSFILQGPDLALRGPGAFLELRFWDSMGWSGSGPRGIASDTAGLIIFIISNGSGHSCR